MAVTWKEMRHGCGRDDASSRSSPSQNTRPTESERAFVQQKEGRETNGDGMRRPDNGTSGSDSVCRRAGEQMTPHAAFCRSSCAAFAPAKSWRNNSGRGVRSLGILTSHSSMSMSATASSWSPHFWSPFLPSAESS